MFVKDQQPVRFEVYLTKNAEPLIFYLQKYSSTIDLCYQLLAIYNRPPATEIILKNYRTEMDELHLCEMENVDSRLHNKFLISFCPIDLEIDLFYQFLTRENAFPSPLITYKEYKSVILHNSQKMKSFKKNLFHRQILYLTIKDIIKGHTSKFSNFLPLYFQEAEEDANTSLFSFTMIINVFIEIISTMFADKYEWISEDKTTGKPKISDVKSDFYELQNFSKFLVDLIEKGCKIKDIFRYSFDEFKPAYFIVDLIQLITDELINRFDNPTVFKIVIELFGSKWLYNLFTDKMQIETFLNRRDYFDLYPYLAIRYTFYRYIQEQMTQFDLESIFDMYSAGSSIFINQKSMKAVCKSMFEAIYEIIEAEDSPCLTLSQAKQKSILKILEHSSYIIKKYFGLYAYAQNTFLNVFSNILMKYEFEPKGLCFIIIDYFIKAGVLHEQQLEAWLQQMTPSSPFKESMMVELNTFVISSVSVSQAILTDS